MARDNEVALIEAFVDATTGEGIGPVRGLEIAQAIERVVPAVVELVKDDPDGGPAQVLRAVDYVAGRARSVKAQHDESKGRRSKADTEADQDQPTDPEPEPEPEPEPVTTPDFGAIRDHVEGTG